MPMSPFEITDIINTKGTIPEDVIDSYNAYVINKVLSNTVDSVLFANEMNRYWSIPNQQQFDFYYHGLPKKKRFGKWHKNQDDAESLNLIQEYYGYSRKRAKDVLSLLRPNVAKPKAGTA